MKAFSLVGVDRNAFSVMGYVVKAMNVAHKEEKKSGENKFGREAVKEYNHKAMSGDYDSLICLSVDMIKRINEFLGLEEEDGDW